MHELMLGMFWGGVVMAFTPVAVGVGICVMLIRHERELRASAEQGESGSD
jgi:hypothetical protein